MLIYLPSYSCIKPSVIIACDAMAILINPLQAPVLTVYACGNGVVPMPFRRQMEALVGVPALSTMEVMTARDYLKKQQEANNAATALAP